MNRSSVRIIRAPITVGTDNGVSYGGWAHFSVKDADPKPTGVKLKRNERILFCPYCGAWTVFKTPSDDQYTWKCTGWCKWSNTNDYYVRKENGLLGVKSSKAKKK